MLTQLELTFNVPYPAAYKEVLRWLGTMNLDLVQLSPIGCMFAYNFYTSLVFHTLLPLAAVGALMVARKVLKPTVGSRCALCMFCIIFFVYVRPERIEHETRPLIARAMQPKVSRSIRTTSPRSPQRSFQRSTVRISKGSSMAQTAGFGWT